MNVTNWQFTITLKPYLKIFCKAFIRRLLGFVFFTRQFIPNFYIHNRYTYTGRPNESFLLQWATEALFRDTLYVCANSKDSIHKSDSNVLENWFRWQANTNRIRYSKQQNNLKIFQHLWIPLVNDMYSDAVE